MFELGEKQSNHLPVSQWRGANHARVPRLPVNLNRQIKYLTASNKILYIDTPTIVEANRWRVNTNGRIELIASADNGLLFNKFNP